MNIDYINPFIEASQTVLKQIASIDAKLGKVYLKEAPYKSDCILILVGLTGSIRGAGYIFNEQVSGYEHCFQHDVRHAGYGTG